MKKVIALVAIMATVLTCPVGAAATTSKDDGEYSYVTENNENYFVKGDFKDGIDQYISAATGIDNYFKTNKEIASLSSESDYYIPYGFFKNGNKYINKNSDGSFTNVPAGQGYKQYKLPNGVETFGLSHNEKSGQPVFGSYADNLKTEGIEYGTMLMVGDWEAFKNNFLTGDRTVAQLLEKVSSFYDENKADYNYVGLEWKDSSNNVYILKVYKTPQKNCMWKNGEHIQYAVRTNGLAENTDCSAVGYYTADGKTVFSTQIKTGTVSNVQ